MVKRTETLPKRVQASAPAKVILFGEHSVVYGAPAIATAIDGRTTVEITKLSQASITFNLPAIGKTISWNVPLATATECEESCKAVSCARLVTKRFSHLFEQIQGLDVTVSSNIPVGAGLGSSASFSVALCAAFFHFEDMLKGGNGNLKQQAIMDLAYECEKIFHGNPSGLDTSVVAMGGIIEFQKSGSTTKLANSLPVKLIIVDSDVSRDTATIVKKTKALRDRYPLIIDKVYEAMKDVAHEASIEIQKSATAEKLIDLARINHGLLYTLGVSHPQLEKIKIALDGLDVGFKLTGAGCGGNAVVLVPSHIDEKTVLERLRNAGFEKSLAVSAGGPGLQVKYL